MFECNVELSGFCSKNKFRTFIVIPFYRLTIYQFHIVFVYIHHKFFSIIIENETLNLFTCVFRRFLQWFTIG